MNEVLRAAGTSSFGAECSEAICALYETIGSEGNGTLVRGEDMPTVFFARSFAVILEDAVRQLQLLRQNTTTIPLNSARSSGEASMTEFSRVEITLKDEPEKEIEKSDGERGKGDKRDMDCSRERGEHRGRDHKKKKRKRSRSHRDRSRERRDDRKRRKMGLPSHPKAGTTTIASCTVWLGGLPEMNEDELRSSISELNSASQIQLMPTHSCAYVTMKDRRAAVKLLEKAKGMRVKETKIKSSWTAGNGTKDEKWRSYWDEDRGISSISHKELPLDAMNDLCDGGWLDVSTLPIHLRGIIDEAGEVIVQSASTTSLLNESASHSSSLHSNCSDREQVQLRPPPLLDLALPNPMPQFDPNAYLDGASFSIPPPPMWMGGPPFVGRGFPNGMPPFVRAQLPPPPVLFQMLQDLWSGWSMAASFPPPPALFLMLQELWAAWSMAV